MRFATLTAALFLVLGVLDARLASARRAAATRDPYASLPAAVRRAVERRGCRPPRRPDADSSAVVRGALYAAAPIVRDWAVLCMVDTTARVLVFRDGDREPTAALPFWASPSRLPADSGESRLCEGGVWLVRAAVLRDLVRAGDLADADDRLDAAERGAAVHDGILDGDCEGVSTVHYWTGRRWVLLPGGD